VHAHEQATKQGPKIMEFKLTVQEKKVVIDEKGTTFQAMTFNGSMHRAYVTDFIRDARAGGCASGTPPTNLGFRLVREPKSLLARVAAVFGRTSIGRTVGRS